MPPFMPPHRSPASRRGPRGNVRATAARELGTHAPPGDNAGMAGDDGMAQVQLDEDTLASADNLAFSLQGVRGQAARELGEDTLARRRRVLGEDHPDTLATANGLAISLRVVGERQAARETATSAVGNTHEPSHFAWRPGDTSG